MTPAQNNQLRQLLNANLRVDAGILLDDGEFRIEEHPGRFDLGYLSKLCEPGPNVSSEGYMIVGTFKRHDNLWYAELQIGGIEACDSTQLGRFIHREDAIIKLWESKVIAFFPG
jgi:hypothetical protein